MRHTALWLAAVAVAATGSLSVTAAQAAAPPATTVAAGIVVPGYSPTAPYTPRTGVIINDPQIRDRQRVIMNHIVNLYDSAPPNSRIRMSDWNIAYSPFVSTAIAAHRRGVSVQIMMSAGVAARQDPRTGDYATLKRGLEQDGRNASRPAALRSFIRTCVDACRGAGGINHAKFLTVSQTGGTVASPTPAPPVPAPTGTPTPAPAPTPVPTSPTARNIVMISSANVTKVAMFNQWNDAFTLVGDAKVYGFYERTFGEMVAGTRGNYSTSTSANFPWLLAAWFNPFRDRPDPIMVMLNKVRCTGAVGAGSRGRTVVRLAHTVLTGDRGMTVAKKVKSLNRAGCITKVVFTLMDRKIRNMLYSTTGTRVPIRQLVRDRDRDGFYDLYLHTKTLTISGNWGGDRGAHVVRTGSENISAKSAVSDETGFDVKHVGYETLYSRWIDSVFAKGTTSYTPRAPSDARVGADPWRDVQLD
ncbi:hypothetical protein ASG49_11355 [Marmoricola sp. Leaf446]|uniref:hypothetical protein n=1 Tax=Marmoricola sp. Leaf446 TaxID=1736379 RepID=UPI0006F91F4B|nr:hypothetical protein [Marmoricola sp. Leaf446]KQT91596.1 hypothetical protein ASG49_11355 [Marmoricola sp. Leaf446]